MCADFFNLIDKVEGAAAFWYNSNDFLRQIAIATKKKTLDKCKEETEMKYGLGFISDEDFFSHVKAMVSRLTVAMNLKKFSENSTAIPPMG